MYLDFVFEWFKHNGMNSSRTYENTIRGDDMFQFLFIYSKTWQHRVNNNNINNNNNNNNNKKIPY